MKIVDLYHSCLREFLPVANHIITSLRWQKPDSGLKESNWKLCEKSWKQGKNRCGEIQNVIIHSLQIPISQLKYAEADPRDWMRKWEETIEASIFETEICEFSALLTNFKNQCTTEVHKKLSEDQDKRDSS